MAYIYKKKLNFFKGFVVSGFLNMILAMGLAAHFLLSPTKFQLQQLQNTLNLQNLKIIATGTFSLLALLIQIIVLICLYKRSKNPQNYHFNYFGQKVLHKDVVKPNEVVLFLACMPCVLIFGAYFFVKIINNFL